MNAHATERPSKDGRSVAALAMVHAGHFTRGFHAANSPDGLFL